jgi:hypothetical protein
MAERGAKRLAVGVAYIATVAKDGGPRVHPFTPLIAGERLLFFAGKHTIKYRGLLRDPRFAVHAALGKDDEEFLVIGRAVESDDWASRIAAAAEAKKIGMISKDDVLFELFVERAHWAVWKGLGTPDIHRVADSWREGQA